MKIQSNSMQQALNGLVQDSNTSQTPASPKQILPDAQSFQSSGQFANTVKLEQSMIAKNRAAELHATFGGDKKLGQLREQLGDLKNEKQGLISQIVATSQKLAGAQLVNDQPGIAAASAQLEELKGELAKVEVKIKAVLQEIEKLGQQEEQEQDRIRNQQEAQDKVQSNLSKTADSYSQLLKNIIDP